jgi:uncharacterized membrane protein
MYTLYNIIYPIIIIVALFIILILIFKRIDEKKNEDFESRDN